METIGQRVRAMRERRLWSQRDLSERAGVPQATISRVESDQNETRPQNRTIISLAQALDVDPAWIMFGGDETGKAAARDNLAAA